MPMWTLLVVYLYVRPCASRITVVPATLQGELAWMRTNFEIEVIPMTVEVVRRDSSGRVRW